MAQIYLIRHAKTGVPWNPIHNSELNTEGIHQVSEWAGILKNHLPCTLYSSPLRRAIQSAEPLAKIWQQPIAILESLGEIPLDPNAPLEPMEWLRQIMAKNWLDLSPEINAWKMQATNQLKTISSRAFVFTHYLTISAIVSSITGNPKVDCFPHANLSLTQINNMDGKLQLIGNILPNTLA